MKHVLRVKFNYYLLFVLLNEDVLSEHTFHAWMVPVGKLKLHYATGPLNDHFNVHLRLLDEVLSHVQANSSNWGLIPTK